MEYFKNTCVITWYVIGTIGVIDMAVKAFTEGKLKIIHSVLSFFFG